MGCSQGLPSCILFPRTHDCSAAHELDV
nr:unnamed protein product [Callosobruchus analis]